MPRIGWSTRTLMTMTAVIGVDAVIVIQASRLGFRVEFALFIGAALVTLNLLFASYLKAADRINSAPPDKQTAMVLSMGCLLAVIMALLVPVLVVILIRAQS